MGKKVDKNNLGFLGVDFQYRLVKLFIEEPKFFEKMADIVDQNMFTEPSLRNIVRIMKDNLTDYNAVPDYQSINAELGARNSDEVTLDIDRASLSKIKDEIILNDYDMVKYESERFFKQQNMVKVANKVLSLVKDGNLDNFDACKEEFEKVVEITSEEDDEENPMDEIEEALTAESVVSIPTGVYDIDYNLGGGLDKGKLGLVIGPSGYGKTTMMTAFAYHAATQGHKVLQIIFEDETIDIRRKYISRMTGTEAFVIKAKPENGGLNEEQRKNLYESIKNNPDNELIKKNVRIKRFLPGSGITASDIIAYIRRLINKGFKPDLVTIDYFECIDPEKSMVSRNISEWTHEGITMRKLEGAAKKLDVAIWIPSQGGKDSFTAQIVNMAMGSGSVKKQQIAQVVMSISRTIEDIANNEATLTILKNRAGRSGASFEGISFNNGTCTISFDHVRKYDDLNAFKNNAAKERKTADEMYAASVIHGPEDEDY